jgi:hypothetical protein
MISRPYGAVNGSVLTAAMSHGRRSFLTSAGVAVVDAFVPSFVLLPRPQLLSGPFQWQNNERRLPWREGRMRQQRLILMDVS